MKREEGLLKLREFEAPLRERGAALAPHFGPLAPATTSPSDIDIMVEIAPTSRC